MAVAGLASGTAAAESVCPDYHWIGAAGSGQRTGTDLTAYAGMGKVVYQSYQELSSDLAQSGKTTTAEAVEYPAVDVPVDGSIRGWLGFLDSVGNGADSTAKQFASYTEQCPNTKVVLAGYSQGAMVIHRNLYNLANDPHVVAALLIADGDRLPVDTTVNMGTAARVSGAGKGLAQEHDILARTNTSPLPKSIGSRTISVCDVGDPVCDYDPDTSSLSPAALAVHTAYAPTTTGAHAWGNQLYGIVAMQDSASSAPIQMTSGTR